jgi:hypothetical protein
MSEVSLRSDPQCHRISVSISRMEFSKAMRGVGLRVHKGAHSHRFRSNLGENIKGMGRNDVREVRDHSNAVSGIRSIVTTETWHQLGRLVKCNRERDVPVQGARLA